MTRVFMRLAPHTSPDAALDDIERRGGRGARLHAIPSLPGAVIGSFEIDRQAEREAEPVREEWLS